MSRAEVEELLGGAPGNYGHGGTIYDATAIVVPTGQPPVGEYNLEATEEWRGDDLLIAVKFDQASRVVYAFGVEPAPPLWYRSLQQWFPFLR